MTGADETEAGDGAGLRAPDGRRRMRGWAAFLRRFLRLAGPFWRGRRAIALGAAVAGLTALQVAVPVALNLWIEGLFDTLARRDLERFLALLVVLAGIIAANVAVVTLHLIAKRRLQANWRAWLTRGMVEQWMAAGRHRLVAYLPGEHDNPDGRIAEDARIATEYAIDLAHSLFYVLLLGASFWTILWSLSGELRVAFGGFAFDLPGHLVWAGLAYSVVGMAAALAVGRPMVSATDRRQRFEQDFRFGLAHSRENSAAITLAGGEPNERRRLGAQFGGIVLAWDRQTRAYMRIFFYSASWSVLTQAFPILVAAPRYLVGAITLGALMQIAQAMLQFISALSWPVDNLSRLAEWRASAERIAGLREALDRLSGEVATIAGRGIWRGEGERPVLAFEGLTLAKRSGAPLIRPFSADLREGERVALCGDAEAARRLIEAIAGLWLWGHGRIVLPREAPVFFMPRRPYMPIGPLREAASYPAAEGDFRREDVVDALRRVGLERLTGRLDEHANWEEALSAEERQRMAFARLLLHRPAWIVVEEAASALDPAGKAEMAELIQRELPGAALIAVGLDPLLGRRRPRRLRFEREDGAVAVREEPIAA